MAEPSNPMNDAWANINATPREPANTTDGLNGCSEYSDAGTSPPKMLHTLRTVIIVTSSVMKTPRTFAPEWTPCTPRPRHNTSATKANSHHGRLVPKLLLNSSPA
jgi:hypothetical protein